MKKNEVLITGATGYIGSNLSKYLLEKGFNLHLLVRETSELKGLGSEKHTMIHYYNGKLDSVEEIFNKNQIDFVVHLATVTNYDKSDDYGTLGKLNDVCIGLTSDLFEVIKEQKHLVGFINVGTIWQTQENVENAYTLYKVFQEELVKFFSYEYDIKSISLLLTDTYGPNDSRPKLLNQVKASIRENSEIYIMNPNAVITPVYIDDVIAALYHSISLLNSQVNNFNRYKIKADTSIKVRDLISLCEKFSINMIKVRYASESPLSNVIMSKEVEALPMWKPTFDLKTGLSRFFDDKE